MSTKQLYSLEVYVHSVQGGGGGGGTVTRSRSRTSTHTPGSNWIRTSLLLPGTMVGYPTKCAGLCDTRTRNTACSQGTLSGRCSLGALSTLYHWNHISWKRTVSLVLHGMLGDQFGAGASLPPSLPVPPYPKCCALQPSVHNCFTPRPFAHQCHTGPAHFVRPAAGIGRSHNRTVSEGRSRQGARRRGRTALTAALATDRPIHTDQTEWLTKLRVRPN